ncbi:6713_t:CDS:2 [Entrophospora sp. SA101]|nr:6713_t:CDS:2 [Entrophospora sp. SA101]
MRQILLAKKDSFTNSEKTFSTYSSSATLTVETEEPLSLEGRWIKDSSGRTILLRGINLSGSSKQPCHPQKIPSHKEDFFEHRNVSFVDRPFPLSEADQHFARLKHWGFNFLRFIVTWEALEHKGPGIYDEEFIEFTIKIIKKAKEFSGGSGAPGWTLEVAGLNMKNFVATEAAIVHNSYKDPANYPKMVWSTNYYKLATATMFTLFYSGKIFAPKCIVDGINIQDYLQNHFCNAYKRLAEKICDAKLNDTVVVGYDTQNEPSWGLATTKDLNKIPKWQEYRKGVTPSFFQSMLLGEGIPCKIDIWDLLWYGFSKIDDIYIDPKGKKAWLEKEPEGNDPWKKSSDYPKGCIWAAHGVWDKQSKELLKPGYFNTNPLTGEELDWYEECFKPFVQKYSSTIRSVHTHAIIFIQPPVLELPPKWNQSNNDSMERIIYSPHWYDGLTLTQKHFNWWNLDYLGVKRGKYFGYLPALRIGTPAIKKNFADQLGVIKEEAKEYLGEIGIPYDLDNGEASRTGDYSQQIKAMDANISALEANLLNYTIWNYCSDNNFQWGDQWNGEDLSIYSLGNEQNQDDDIELPNNCLNSMEPSKKMNIKDLNKGGRALQGLLRPFPMKTYGEPVSLEFNPWAKIFKYVYRNLSASAPPGFPTEIYLPTYHFGGILNVDFTVKTTSGLFIWDKDEQKICYWHQIKKDIIIDDGEKFKTIINVTNCDEGLHTIIIEVINGDGEDGWRKYC